MRRGPGCRRRTKVMFLATRLWCQLSFLAWATCSQAATYPAAQILRDMLLKDVQAIDSGGLPGVLLCDGRQSCPLVMGKMNKVELPVAVAAEYEQGRVIALGHPGFYSPQSFKKADTGAFMLNAFRWTMQEGSTVLVFKNKEIIPVLQEMLGPQAQVSEIKNWTQLSTNTATLVASAEDIPEREIERVRDYLKQGGGFMTSAIGWGWMMVTKKSVKGESRFNHLLNPAGLYVTDGTLERTSEQGYAVKSIPAGATVLEALDLVTAEQPAKAALPQASATLCTFMTLVEDDDATPLGKRLKALLLSKAAVKLPTLKQPLRDADVAARLQRINFQSAWQKSPLQNWAAAPEAAAYPGTVSKDVLRETKTVSIALAVPKWHRPLRLCRGAGDRDP
jgi:hypothetical protein